METAQRRLKRELHKNYQALLQNPWTYGVTENSSDEDEVLLSGFDVIDYLQKNFRRLPMPFNVEAQECLMRFAKAQ